LALTALTGFLGAVAVMAERELATLALGIYDDAFMSVSYLRAAQVGFAKLAADRGAADPGAAARNPEAADPGADPDGADEVLDDLNVVRDRAMSAAGKAQAEALRAHIVSVLERARAEPGTVAASVAAVQAEFERVVETFAADGFRYRRGVGEMVAAQARRTGLAIGASLLAALAITLVISGLIAPPVRRAVRVAQAIAAGNLDNAIVPRGRGETADLLRALSTMQASIAAAMARINRLMAEQAASHAGQLAAQHARLEAALESMNQGLCLFGPDGRLAVANRRFAEMFGAPDVGASPEQLLAAGGLEAVRDGTAGGGAAGFSCNLPDGRAIAVSQRPVAGGGWVTTYEDVTERRAAEARLAHMARHDALTGLPNRLLLGEYMPQALARARRTGGVGVLCLDLDRFKAVNDALGHAAGDALLRAVTQRLRDCTRESDLIVRLGGDEFAIVQEAATQPTEATALARRLIEVIAAPFDLEGQQVVIGTSVGIALSEDGLARPETLLKCADLALYRAKVEGRGMFRFFEPEMDTQMQLRRGLELDLRRALAEGQFELFYQPLVSAGSGAITGFEALLRWRHPARGLVSPAVFIPVAEELGLIGGIGAWALQRACGDAAAWPGAPKVAVNLSPAQFRTRVLTDDVADALSASGLPPGRLELEITESVMLQDDDSVLNTLHALRALGVRIAMDDFGTGYSSLSYLRRFPFDKIKIDQSFVRGMAEQGDCLAIVRAVIGLGRSLEMAVNAEGVETPEQLAALRAEGCSELQGYLFSRPKPEAEVRAMLLAGPRQIVPCEGYVLS
jgi:diguanylate cyclase (GGDEF)-like protein